MAATDHAADPSDHPAMTEGPPVHVLVTFPAEGLGELAERIEAVSPRVRVAGHPMMRDGTVDPDRIARELSDELRAALADAEVILAVDLPSGMGELAPNLRWVQAVMAGVDHLRAVLADEILLTNAKGLAAAPIAEFVFARLLETWKHLRAIEDSQRRHEWTPRFGRELGMATLGVVGLGAIGTAVATLGRAFGMRVLAVRRNPAPGPPVADEVVGIDRLHEVLAASDVVVLTAPATPETDDLMDAGALAVMRPGAVLCNVARGSLIDEVALLDALERGHLGAAILDVTKEEPLPPDSPLWDAPNLFLSPHCSASLDHYADRLFELFADNLGRYLRGERMRNEVDQSTGY